MNKMIKSLLMMALAVFVGQVFAANPVATWTDFNTLTSGGYTLTADMSKEDGNDKCTVNIDGSITLGGTGLSLSLDESPVTVVMEVSNLPFGSDFILINYQLSSGSHISLFNWGTSNKLEQWWNENKYTSNETPGNAVWSASGEERRTVAVTYAKDGGTTTYVNGNLLYNNSSLVQANNEVTKIYIGSLQYGVRDYKDSNMKVHSLRIYKKKLTDAEVAQEMVRHGLVKAVFDGSKLSAGELTLAGENTATGTLTVNKGATLNLSGSWNGDVEVYGTVKGTGTISGVLKVYAAELDASNGALKAGQVWLMDSANGVKVKLPENAAAGTVVVYCNNPQPAALISDLENKCEGFKFVSVEENGYKAIKIAAAKIGDTKYATLDAAVTAATEGQTITLISDVKLAEPLTIPEGETVMLDLNGKTVNGDWADKSAGKHIYALKNCGVLTITDSSEAKSGAINSRGIYNYASLTLEAGAINAIDGNGGYAVYNQSGSTFVMNGGVVAATYEDDYKNSSGGYDATALNVPAGATATLNGGKIINVCDFTFAIQTSGTLNIPATSTIEVAGTHGAIAVQGGATTIDAGKFSIPADEYSRTDNVIYVSGGKLVINGGTFTGDSDTASGGSCLCDTVGTATINGGTFSGSSGGDVWGTTGTTIKGGTFSNLTETQHIADGFKLDENGQVVAKPVVAKIGEVGYATLQAAINAAQGMTGEVTISLVADTAEKVTVNEKVDLYLTIDGKNGDAKFNSTGNITINPLSDENANRLITIQNIAFVNTADTEVDFISSVKTNHYPRIAVKDCSFTGNGKDTDVAVRAKTAYGMVIENCTATGLHSFLQNTAGKDLAITRVTVTNSKSGLALGTVQGVTVKGCYIDVAGYGIRMDAQYNNNAVLESNTVKAFIPVVVRNASVDSNVTVSGSNTMTATNADGLWFAIGTSEYETNGTMPTAPTGKVVVTLNDTNLSATGIYGNYVIAMVNGVKYSTLDAAVAAAQEGDVITFLSDVEQADGVLITDKKLTIDLNGKTFTVSNGANTNNRNFKIDGASEVVISNGTMVAAGNYSSGAYGTVRTEGTAKVTLTDLKLYNYRGNGLNIKALNGTTVTMADVEIYSQYGGGIEAAGGTIELTDVVVEQKGMYTAPYNSMAISVNGGGTVTVQSGTYSTECIAAEDANNQGTSHGPWVAGVLNSGGTLIINGGTFSNDNFGENSLATYARGAILADTAANIQINGGTFNALKAIIDITNNLGDASKNPSATLNGGTYSADPRVSGLYASNLIKVAEGYVVTENNGVWTVAKAVAKIDDTFYTNLVDAFKAAKEGEKIVMLADATPALTSQRAITKAAVIDLNGKTLTLTEDDLYFGTTTFKNGNIVVDPSVKSSTAVFWMFANQTLTFDNVKLVATGVTGTYLIGLDGNNADLNVLNGSEIVVENTTALDLDIICVNASTGNDIVINNSKVKVTNLDGRVFFRGNYTISGTSDIDLSGITKAGFRIEAGQTLTIADTATVDIAGEPRDGGIHLTDNTSTYTKADTATVNATVNKLPVVKIGETDYDTIAEALAAAKSGDTIELLTDVTVEGTAQLPAGITIKSNGKKINGSIRMLGDLTLDGPLTITGGLWVGKSGETLTATLSGAKLTASYFMFQHGTYTINADIDAVYGYLSYNGTFEVNSTIHTTGANGEVLYINGNVTLNDGAVLDSDNSVFVCNDNAVLTLKAGSTVDSNVNITTSGAKVYVDATGMTSGANANITGKVTNSGNGTVAVVNSDMFVAQIVNGKIVLVGYVAKIGEQKYTSLQSAIEAVQNGETVTLLADVDVTTPAYGQNALNHARNVNFTLDLNGKTLTANTGNSVFRFNIANSGATSDVAITIRNGKVVAGSNTWCALMAAGISADVKAVMNLENLTVECSKAGDLGVKAWDYALVSASNVTVNATNGAGGFYAVGGEIVLNDCTVNQKGLHTAPYLSMAFAVSTNGKMTVNSGTYSAEPTAATEGYNQGTTHGSWVGGVMNSGGTLIINGGTFFNGNFGEDSLATNARGLIFADTKGIVEVNGGTFNALKSIYDFQNNLGGTSPVITVKGGTYSANPSAVTSYGSVVIPEGYVVNEVSGVYTVAKAVAKLGDTFYSTFAEAYAAAKAGDTITLLRDVTLTSKLTLNKAVTVDGNGHSIVADSNIQWYTVSGKFNIKNYSPWVVVTAQGCELKNVVIDCNSCAGGVKIENADAVIFDTVSIIKSKADTLTVTGSLLIENYFKAEGSSSTIDARNGVVTVAEDTIFDMDKFSGNVSPAKCDLKAAVDTNGKPYFCAYGSTTYYRTLTSIAGTITDLTLLDDVSLEKDLSVKGTLNLNKKTLTLAEGKVLNTGGNLTITGGAFANPILLTSASCTVTAPDGLNVITNVEGKKVVYENGVYKLVDIVYAAQIGEQKYETLQAALDAAVAGAGNVTVDILSDIDMTGKTWTPVAVDSDSFITVNGKSKTITGLSDMLFASTWAGTSGLVINDLTIADSTIVHDENDSAGNIGVGAFVGYPQASATVTLNNCHLKDSTVKGGHWTGGLVGIAGGYNGTDGPVFMTLTIDGCSVTGSTITGKGSAGGIIGHGSCSAWTDVIIVNSTVSNNTITSTGSSDNKAGSVMGTIGAAGQPTTVNGVTKTGGMSVSVTTAGNTVKSADKVITTIYGRQGTETGLLEIAGGTYESYPIEENVEYAAPKDGYIIFENADGKYGVKEGAYVAQINGVKYETLASALAAAQNDAVVELLWADGDAPIAMNGSVYGKSVTITGTATVDWSKGFLFVGRGGEGNGTVIFDNADLESASDNASTGIHVSGREKNTNNKYDGTVVINNSTIELDYLIDKGAMTMTNSTLTVKNGFAVGGRPASETESGVDATATFDLTNGSTLIVNNHNGMGLGWEAIGVMTIDSTSTFECTQSFLVTDKGVLKSAGNIFGDIVKSDNAQIELTGGIYTDEEVQEWCVEPYAALPNLNDQYQYVVGVKPTATVNSFGATTISAGNYGVWNGSSYTGTSTVDMPLSFVMQFLADQTAADMATSPFADWYGDFVITFTGIKNDSFIADGCYLAGYYGDFGWVKIPVDGMKIENGVRYPVMLGVGLGQKYDYICSGVQDFKCAMFLTPEILEANPNLEVKLELAVVDNSKGSDAAASALVNNEKIMNVVDYTYDVDDFMPVELPEVEVVDIKSSLKDSDPDLTFALNFAIKDADKLSEEYLEKLFAKYGDYYTDYVLTISGLTDPNGSVKFNANGNGDGYLAGQYDAWSENWVSVPFENVTVQNGQSLYIMEYAAKLMGKQGLRFTLAEVAKIVQNFDCGVYFTPEFLAANPNLKVDLKLKVFTEDENGNKVDDISVAKNEFDKDDFGVAAVVAEGKQTRYFASLVEAINAADGKTVRLLSDVELTEGIVIPSGKNVTLDLAGFDVTRTVGNVAANTQVFCNNGTFTITDSAEEDGEISLTYTGDRNSNVSISTISNYGVLNIAGGTVKCISGNQYISYAIDAFSPGTVNISGGKVTGGASGYCIRMFLASTTDPVTLNVTGGEVGYVWAQQTNANANKGVINVTGGKVDYVYIDKTGTTICDASNVSVSIKTDATTYEPHIGNNGYIAIVDGYYKTIAPIMLDIRIVNGKPQIGFAGEGKLVLNAATALTGEWTKNVEYTAVENDGDDTKTWVTPKDGYYFFKGYIVR